MAGSRTEILKDDILFFGSLSADHHVKSDVIAHHHYLSRSTAFTVHKSAKLILFGVAGLHSVRQLYNRGHAERIFFCPGGTPGWSRIYRQRVFAFFFLQAPTPRSIEIGRAHV